MLAALGLALGDLTDRGIIGVIVRSALIALSIFVGLAILAGWQLDGADPCDLVTLGQCPLNSATGYLGGVVFGLVTLWLLFPAVAIGVISNFFDLIMAAVERRHYPDLMDAARPLGASGSLALGLRSGLRALLYNLIALPFYILLLVTGAGPLLLFLAVNGVALGRDLGEMVGRRHLPAPDRRAWLAESRVERTLLGAAVTALFLVPIVNLVAPVIGAAAAIHLFARGRGARAEARASGQPYA